MRPSERGTATVEFALVLPLLLMTALALVQVGLLARDRLLLESVARAGAREAAVQADAAAIREAAIAAGPGLDAGAIELSVVRSGSVGDAVAVSVRYLDPIRVPFVTWLVGTSVGMTADATTRQEFVP